VPPRLLLIRSTIAHLPTVWDVRGRRKGCGDESGLQLINLGILPLFRRRPGFEPRRELRQYVKRRTIESGINVPVVD
jgi:hypothetical protein